MSSKRKGVRPMTRLIERGEFEKRLSDYSDNIAKAFAFLHERLTRLEGAGAPPPASEPPSGVTPPATSAPPSPDEAAA